MITVLFIYNESTDPYFNLAAEEYLVKHHTEEIFMLWRNDNTIVVGRNQNTLAEINHDYVKQHNIQVVRRMSGGGAVFHDMGNINFTFIVNSDKDFSNYEKFTAPVIGFLRQLGVDARLKGRNDLVICDKKISGNAQYMYQNRVLHHGTLLYCAEENHLTQALAVSEDKIKSKGIKSISSRVTNIASHLTEQVPPEEFIKQFSDYMIKSNPDCQHYDLKQDEAEIQKLRDEKYATWDWNFGYSPKYTFSRKERFPFGGVEVQMELGNQSVIEHIKIFGDFFSQMPVSELEEKLVGVPHQPEAIKKALSGVAISNYIQKMEPEEFIKLLF